MPGFAAFAAATSTKNGVVWASLTSGHLGSFDRRKCKGPLQWGQRQQATTAPRSWSFYKYTWGPGFDFGIGDNSAEASYYTWVDGQHNTLGLGDDGSDVHRLNLNDGFVALKDGKMVMLPRPLIRWDSVCQGGWTGRIDDPNAGWKGRGL